VAAQAGVGPVKRDAQAVVLDPGHQPATSRPAGAGLGLGGVVERLDDGPVD
jgi:hypothetical protein